MTSKAFKQLIIKSLKSTNLLVPYNHATTTTSHNAIRSKGMEPEMFLGILNKQISNIYY